MNKKKPEPNDNNLAIAYYRYSSSSQNEASIDQQREQAERFAESRGLTIIKEYKDEAKSGTTSQRPGYQLMLSEVVKLKPHALILWKSDRLSRDTYDMVFAKKTIRDAGCEILYVAEPNNDDGPTSRLMEAMLDALAVNYSENLSMNIKRGNRYNAEHALFCGHKIFGYIGEQGKPYAVDPATAPAVQRMFKDYAEGVPMKQIAESMNSQGFRTVRGGLFNSKNINKMLKNRKYTGIYSQGGVTIPDGMPRLIDDDLFKRVQLRLASNKRHASQNKENAPRYWLSGKLYCGHCGEPMYGMSGTSKTGAKHYYYACKAHRAHNCDMKNLRKDVIETLAKELLRWMLCDTSNTASLATDLAAYYEEHNNDTAYLDSLKDQLKDVEKKLNNFVKAISAGIINETTQQAMTELETRRTCIVEAISAEEARQALTTDGHSIADYYKKYINADLDDAAMRDTVIEYFVKRIVVDDEGLTLVFDFDQDDLHSDWSWLSGQEDFNPFAQAEVVKKFDRFRDSSTIF